jgi:hypothetical protein
MFETMADPPNPPRTLADQVALLTEEVDQDRASRRKAGAERAHHAAAVHTWLSRDRAVLVAFIIALPILGVLVWMNVTDQSFAELLTPGPPPRLARQQAQDALDSVVKQIGLYRDDYSMLPDSVAEVGAARGEWIYTKGPQGSYVVRLRMNGQILTYDSLAGK